MSNDGHDAAGTAWQPFSFGGVAAFATSSWFRLVTAQIIAAVIVSGSLVWFLGWIYSPVVAEAIGKLPQGAMVSAGQLQGVADSEISENHFLAIAVTSDPTVDFGQSADVQIEFRGAVVQVSSIFRSVLGSLEFAYPEEGMIDVSRSNLEPKWGAWRPIFLAAAGVSTVVVLLGLWAVLAAIYAAPAKFIAWVADRQLSWCGAWRLSSAALLPGAMVMALDVVLYGWRVLDLVGFGGVAVAHLVVGWIYILISPGFAPRLFLRLDQNPFGEATKHPPQSLPDDSSDATGLN